jgi:hypothetical protein
VRNQESSWDHQHVIESRDKANPSVFGWPVSLSDDALLVGAPADFAGGYGYNGCNETEEIPGAGAIYVFDTTLWDEVACIKATPPEILGLFGATLDQHQGTYVVGSSSYLNTGVAYAAVYETSTGW